MILNGGLGSAFDVVIHTKDMQHLQLNRYVTIIKKQDTVYISVSLFFNTTVNYVASYIFSHDIYILKI